MMKTRFPYIPPDVIDALERQIQPPNPRPGDSLEMIMFRAGQYRTVQFLKEVSEEQRRGNIVGDP